MQRDQQAEAQENQEVLDIPAELKRRESRQAALQKARRVIEERAREMAAAQQADYQAKMAAQQQQRDAGKKPRGQEPQPPSAEPDPKAQYNFTDPQSRIMKAGNGPHFEQAYNAQAAVDGAMLIVGERLSDAPNDKQELAPSVAAISAVVREEVQAVLVDSGFYSEAAVAAVEQKEDGTPTRNRPRELNCRVCCFVGQSCWRSAFRLFRAADMLKHELQQFPFAKQKTLLN